MTQIIRAPTALSNPTGILPLPNIVDNLFVKWKASDLALSNGADVTGWIAGDGLANSTIKNLNQIPTTAAPKMSTTTGPNSGKAVVFDGSCAIRHSTTFTAQAQPITLYGVVRVDQFTGNSTTANRIVASATGSMLRPSTTPILVAGLGSEKTIVSGLGVGTWYAVAVTLNGANSLSFVNGTAFSGDMGSDTLTRVILGGSAGLLGTVTTGFKGAIAELGMFTRAFRADELSTLVDKLKLTYPGIS